MIVWCFDLLLVGVVEEEERRLWEGGEEIQVTRAEVVVVLLCRKCDDVALLRQLIAVPRKLHLTIASHPHPTPLLSEHHHNNDRIWRGGSSSYSSTS